MTILMVTNKFTEASAITFMHMPKRRVRIRNTYGQMGRFALHRIQLSQRRFIFKKTIQSSPP